jgi:hypothetical protein
MPRTARDETPDRKPYDRFIFPPPETSIGRWSHVGRQRLSEHLGYDGPNDTEYKKMLASRIGFLPP